MQGIIYEEASVLTFLFVTIVLGGLGAWMTGRACAKTWRPRIVMAIYVAMTEAFTPGEKSQNNLIGKIQDAAVSAVVVGALQADAAVIANEMRARGLNAALIGNESLALAEFKALAGATAEGSVFFLPFVDKSRPEAVNGELPVLVDS